MKLIPPLKSCQYDYTFYTIKTAHKLDPETVSGRAHFQGMLHAEPLIVIMDSLLQYALVYKVRFEADLASDYVLGPEWLSAAKGIRGLLNGDGAFAMARDCCG